MNLFRRKSVTDLQAEALTDRLRAGAAGRRDGGVRALGESRRSERRAGSGAVVYSGWNGIRFRSALLQRICLACPDVRQCIHL